MIVTFQPGFSSRGLWAGLLGGGPWSGRPKADPSGGGSAVTRSAVVRRWLDFGPDFRGWPGLQVLGWAPGSRGWPGLQRSGMQKPPGRGARGWRLEGLAGYPKLCRTQTARGTKAARGSHSAQGGAIISTFRARTTRRKSPRF